MFRFLLTVILLAALFNLALAEKMISKDTVTAPGPDTISLIAYTSPNGVTDSLKLQRGDSIFLYDGELFYRGRSNGHDFFISRREIMNHSDSLVIYQNVRLLQPGSSSVSGDGVVQKVERQRCSTITRNGTRCKRFAMPGSDKCWQHKK